ncbi:MULTISPECIES: LCP family protein [unclassified Streptomyces]|uniref:LCP family protein n=1 Tax=unclassified Streptomyces TaxID=2593676 RepID=UPI002DDAFC27|nr:MULTISPECIES: LCP family protein [unclassified Streptomyces]WSA94352.1 LCP family protein [Streptomyces sp. NBC_01795]WSB78770.1 LCP family protein [Streptomyces sp. NBC_01775]WSS13026.1 LCP family protein [Streptomyces sp. NBC_01186]WSS41810.1 LCP family protein [Streptomyces sp. NBC_01187]
MRHNGTRGGRGARRGAPSAAERGWDESLYEGHPPRQGDESQGPHGPGADAVRRAVSQDSSPDGGDEQNGNKNVVDERGRRRRPRRKRRVLRWFVIILALLILGTAGAGYLYYRHLNDNLGKDELNLGDQKLDKSDPNAAGQTPMNILLLGSDSRASKANVELGGSKGDRERPPLADVQMLLHVSADRSNMSVISVPRDTKTTIPKCTDPDDGKVYPKTTDRINTSLQHGGPGCTVATWEEMTGIPVDHFMMIDFAGVVSMADAVGGVPVCVNSNVYDPRSKLKLKKGSSTIQGKQALSWLRTRHGFGDGTDIGRAKAQHMYMNSMVRQLKAGTKLTDPGKMRGLAEAATKALTVDNGIGTVKKLYDLGNDLKRVPTKRITMTTMPWEYSQGGAYVVPKEGDSDQVFSLMRRDVALDGKDKKKPGAGKSPQPTEPSQPKAQIPIRVMNGTGTSLQRPVTGRAGAVAGVLTRKGFSQAATDSTPKSQADSTITYPTEQQRGDALAVAKSLGIPERLVKHSSGVDQVTLVVGTDWREGDVYPKGDKGAGKGGDQESDKTPDSADALNGNDKKACMKVNPNSTW